jgi:two-component system phosphate regulon sensor histidine kinase PhoR
MGRVKTQEKVVEYYQIIGKETQRLAAMVNKILNFSKMENGKRQFNFTVCNLNEITHKVLETYEFHLESKEFTYTYQPDINIPNGFCDAEAVADSIINLIDNAVKYSRDTKKIEITTGLAKKMAWIEVKDYGIGIAKKNQKLVFDKFYRVTNENLANEVKGTGLGLSIVAETIKAHKGKITLNSKLGEGSAFRLYFPVIQQNIK